MACFTLALSFIRHIMGPQVIRPLIFFQETLYEMMGVGAVRPSPPADHIASAPSAGICPEGTLHHFHWLC